MSAADISEAVWETAVTYGVRLSVADQVALVRVLADSANVTPTVVRAAFARCELPPPSKGFAQSLVAALRRANRIRLGAAR